MRTLLPSSVSSLNAMWKPSGDQDGDQSLRALPVMTRRRLPSALMATRSPSKRQLPLEKMIGGSSGLEVACAPAAQATTATAKRNKATRILEFI